MKYWVLTLVGMLGCAEPPASRTPLHIALPKSVPSQTALRTAPITTAQHPNVNAQAHLKIITQLAHDLNAGDPYSVLRKFPLTQVTLASGKILRRAEWYVWLDAWRVEGREILSVGLTHTRFIPATGTGNHHSLIALTLGTRLGEMTHTVHAQLDLTWFHDVDSFTGKAGIQPGRLQVVSMKIRP